MLSTLSGLGGQPLTLKADPNVSLNTSGVSQDIRDRMRPAPNLQGADLVEQIQMRMQQKDIKTPAFMKYAQDVFDTQGYPTQSLQYYQNQFGGSPLGAMIPEQGPLGSGLVGGIPPTRTPGSSGGVSLDSLSSLPTPTQIPEGGAPKIGGPAIMPPNNTGIGSLTQNPINTTPESSITGSIGSPYLNNNQDLDQYLNSYVENLINRRMRDIFGGIMSIFQ